MRISVSAEINPTESPEKLLGALTNIFPLGRFTREGNMFAFEGDEDLLAHFSFLLEKQRIRDSANVHMHLKTHHDRLKIFLNKQAAYMGKVNFCSDCAMGPITILAEGEGLSPLIDRISPRT